MTEPVRISLRVPGTAPMPELLSFFQRIEDAGFDGAGVLDSQMLGRDTFVILGQAASHTKRITLFPAVTNPFTRHASVLAGATQTVEEMAPGRIKCVIGTGYTSASTIGRKPATLAEMRVAIPAVKSLLAGERVDWGGTKGRLPFASGRHIPVIMAASGPKAIELAGEIADGVMLLIGFNRTLVQWALGHLEIGAKRSGRRLEDLDVNWAVRVGTAATTAEARRAARPIVVHWGIRYGEQIERAGMRIPKIEETDAIRKIYPDLAHADDWEAAIAATSTVSDEIVGELCEALGLVGTPQDRAERIVEMTKLGPRNIYLMPFETFALPEPELTAFRDVVFPHLHANGLR